MDEHAPGTQHLIPDFLVSRLDGGKFQAIAQYEISKAHAEYGCRASLEADSLEDLEVLCAAERIKISFIDDAADPHGSLARAIRRTEDARIYEMGRRRP